VAEKGGGVVRMEGESHGCWGDRRHCVQVSTKLDHIGVGAYSTLAGEGARHFCQRL